MSLVEEPAQNDVPKVPEIRLQDNEVSNECDPKDQKDENTEKRPVSPLSFLREDLRQFKEDLLKMFRDKDADQSDQAASSHDLVKGDSSRFEVVVARAFQSTDPKSSQSAEKPINRLSFLNFSNVFRLGNISEQNEETVDAEKLKNNLEDGMKEVEVAETTSLSESHHGGEMIPTPRAAEQRCESEESSESGDDERMNKEEAEQEEEEKPSETLLLQPLSSEINLFRLRDSDQDDERRRPGGISWTVKNFACYLTFDPNTANSELRLSDSNRTVTRAWSAQWPPEHPDRFRRCPQVLCREGLLDSAYWEVELRGGADIGVAYNDICRDGDAAHCLLGHNERSWSLECSEGSYAACHANRRFRAAVVPAPEQFASRVGVHLDWSAGALSFYCVSPDAMVHLHTFRETFTEPLYPAFWVWAYDGAVSLSQVELGWERLLQ
ncbi:hypothetical protein EPR50_G00103660 [Perca flavescens]|uniref:B30.2/SPRY domain-containing protein n=1 Tax=Perca flavescens TaxID=8167 RepID=A0A484D2C9_PERFV|nr:hypothetical protein EPR50_G00103660 [Perca flavescens]